MEEFARALRALRERRGINRRALSECLGLSKNMISRYERGERVPPLDIALVIAEFFGVSLDEIAGKNRR